VDELTLFDTDESSSASAGWEAVAVGRTLGQPSSPGPLQRVRMTVAYDGTDFRGLAPNPGVRTVVGEMVAKLEPYVGYRPDIVMSGRTDAGVHATGQVVSFDLPVELAVPGRLQKLLNIGLGPEIVVRDVELVDSDFSARFSATSRRYQYLILNRSVPEPLLARTSWWVPEPLELDVMRLLVVLPTTKGRHRRAVARASRRRGLVAADRARASSLRDLGLGLLPPDGSKHRRLSYGGRAGQTNGRSTSRGTGSSRQESS
jgi:hypothetical protein